MLTISVFLDFKHYLQAASGHQRTKTMRFNYTLFILATISSMPLAMAQTLDQFLFLYDLISQEVQNNNNEANARTLVRMG